MHATAQTLNPAARNDSTCTGRRADSILLPKPRLPDRPSPQTHSPPSAATAAPLREPSAIEIHGGRGSCFQDVLGSPNPFVSSIPAPHTSPPFVNTSAEPPHAATRQIAEGAGTRLGIDVSMPVGDRPTVKTCPLHVHEIANLSPTEQSITFSKHGVGNLGRIPRSRPHAHIRDRVSSATKRPKSAST